MVFNKLNDKLKRVLAKEKFTSPTPIQTQAIPIILEGKDIIGIAQTGTGKTASFVLPLLHMLSANPKDIVPKTSQVLVLAPTRELAMQIDESFELFGKSSKIRHKAIFGGVTQESQIKALSNGTHILTATPGRLIDLISQEKVDLSKVEYVVLDEAHMMLSMGFLPDIKEIFAKSISKKQSLFFSATMDSEILKLSNELLTKPTTVEIKADKFDLMTQKVFYMYVEDKNRLLLELIKKIKNQKTIVFLRTKYKTDVVETLLIKNKISAGAIHSDKTQGERTKAIDDFKSGKIKVLVATNIAARGIHIDDVSYVINYDTPNSPDVYVHRIGRTARAGKSGESYTFCGLEEREQLRKIEEYTGQKMESIQHTYYAAKVENLTSEDIANSVNSKKKYKKMYMKKGSRKSTKQLGVYVPPINQKKAKKPRGIHTKKVDRRR